MTKPLTARIEVFRPGTFKPMAGAAITYSAADLKAVADSYDPATAPAPVVIGHPTTDAPAFGWIESFDYDALEERLFATIGDIEPEFAELVKAGRFRKVSMAFFSPDQPHNPVAGTWYPKHLGFLGAAAPGVPGLKNAQFAGEAGVVFSTSFGVAQEAAGLFGALRDFFIDQFGLESADQALPRWRIDWLEQADEQKTHFAAPPAIPQKPEKEKPVALPPDPAFAAREASLTAQLADVAAREAKLNHAENVAFAEGLVTEGRLLPVSKDKVVAILDALPGEATVAFAEGADKLSPAAALREVLKDQPVVVQFGAMDLGEQPGAGKVASFAADGNPVDPTDLAIHQSALAYQRQNPGTAYLDAVAAVS